MEKEQTGGAETRVTMNNYTKEDIIRLVEEEDVEFIRLQFTDLFGNLKNIAVTASQLDRVLSNKCMFDGSAIDGFARIEESDMYLYPDLSTLEIFPWRPQQGKVARMIRCISSQRTAFRGRSSLCAEEDHNRGGIHGIHVQCRTGMRILPVSCGR